MDGEREKARRLAELLDGTRPEAEASAEERGLLALRGRAQALRAAASEQAALKERLPEVKAGRSRKTAWRAVLTGAAAVAVLALAAVGLNWLIGGRGELLPVGQVDKPVLTAVPWLEVQTTGEPAFHLPGAALWQGAKLAPEVCKGRAMDDDPEVYARLGIGNLNGNLLGGGQIQSGDFTFDYWLVCDFQLENSSRYLASEISGLGMALKWTYTGAGQDGPIVIYAGIEPYISETSFSQSASPGESGMDLRGIELPGDVLPDWNAQDARLRWAVKAELPDGTLAGAALEFTLMRGEDGFTPVDIQLVRLNEAELAGPAASEVSDPPFALLDADAEYPQLAGAHALLAAREAELLSGGGWIHRVSQGSTEQSGEPVESVWESWTQVDGQGRIRAEVAQSRQDGRLVAQSVVKDGRSNLTPWTYRINLGLTRYAVDQGLWDQLVDAARFGQPAVESRETVEGREVIVFTFRDALLNGPIYRESIGGLVYGSATRVGIDAQSGAYLFRETQEFDENGAVVSGNRETIFEERIGAPPENVQALLEGEQMELITVGSLLGRRQWELIADGGWIYSRIVESTGYTASGRAVPDEAYDGWWLVDSQGRIRASITGMVEADGSLSPIFIQQNGMVLDVMTGERSAAASGTYSLGWDTLYALLEFQAAGAAMEQHEETVDGRAALVVTVRETLDPAQQLEGSDFVATAYIHRYVIDMETGRLLLREALYEAEDGSRLLHWATRVTAEERVDAPPEEVMVQFEQPYPALP